MTELDTIINRLRSLEYAAFVIRQEINILKAEKERLENG